ncbi:MAG: prolyl oligopeptidase family serine peptidase [Thermoguttaceae bacterium]
MRASLSTAVACGVLIAIGLCTARMRAAEPDLRSRGQKRVFRSAEGDSLPYRLFVPKDYDASKKYPLILFLHGAGERGDDNERQLVHGQVLRFVSDEVAKKEPCFLVAPQCPKNGWWGELPGRFKKKPQGPRPSTSPLKLVLALLDSLEKEFSIDPDRRYVTGLSMGGFGSYALCLARPDYFAAAVPICGGTDVSRAKEMAQVAFWIFHGGADPVVKPELSRTAVEALKKAGAQVKYTEYPGVGHDSWSKAYNEPELVDWLFAQKRKPK